MTAYNFYYWGPLLFKIKIEPKELKECAKLCSKKDSRANETLAGVIKHEHHIHNNKYYKIIDPYLGSFGHAFNNWYSRPLTKKMRIVAAWVNFMKA